MNLPFDLRIPIFTLTPSLLLLPTFLLIITLILHLYLYYLNRCKQYTPAILLFSQTPATHSPRTSAHLSAIIHHIPTHKIIYLAQPPFPTTHPNVYPISIYPTPTFSTRTPITLFKKLIYSTKSLLSSLFIASRLHLNVTHIIINTPPALPTIPLISFLSPFLFPNASLIIDWHNTAYSLMHTTRSPPITIFIAYLLEVLSSRLAHKHWTVSNALADFLLNRFHIHATVLPDAPHPDFQQLALSPPNRETVISIVEKHAKRVDSMKKDINGQKINIPLIVTSTSWTPDEDFEILFSAMDILDSKLNTEVRLVVTGRGPLRAIYEKRVIQAGWKWVSVWFVWLPIEEYPRLLAVADLGICLHSSSSGLDLPMKVVDLFACGCPVLALRYESIRELVKEKVLGFLFEKDEELTQMLQTLLFKERHVLDRMRERIVRKFSDGKMEWTRVWEDIALPEMIEKR